MPRTIALLCLVAMLLCACAAQPSPVPCTPMPTYTPYPPLPTLAPLATLAPLPTYTPFPTWTAVPKPTDKPTNTPAPTASTGTRQSPAKIGQIVPITLYGTKFDVTITEAIVGQEAAKRIAAANMFNQVPTEGNEFILFYVKAKIVKAADSGKTVSISYSDIKMVDAAGKVWGMFSIVCPSPQFTGSAFEGATIEGWAVHARTVGEAANLAIGMGSDGTGGAWFAIPGK